MRRNPYSIPRKSVTDGFRRHIFFYIDVVIIFIFIYFLWVVLWIVSTYYGFYTFFYMGSHKRCARLLGTLWYILHYFTSHYTYPRWADQKYFFNGRLFFVGNQCLKKQCLKCLEMFWKVIIWRPYHRPPRRAAPLLLNLARNVCFDLLAKKVVEVWSGEVRRQLGKNKCSNRIA